MATLALSRNSAVNVTSGIVAVYKSAQATIAQKLKARKAREELYRLTARELADIGLTYGDIARIR